MPSVTDCEYNILQQTAEFQPFWIGYEQPFWNQLICQNGIDATIQYYKLKAACHAS